MPAKVSNVDWRCPQCGKRLWLKPALAARRKACSRQCGYASQRVENPVREKQGQKLARYGIRQCAECGQDFEAKHQNQLLCSHACSIARTKERGGRGGRQHVDPRPCEVCTTVFTPRVGSAGRFCSRPCTYAGTTGGASPHWKGGRTVRQDGYIMIRVADHPAAQKGHGYVPEHRLVVEKRIGRYLTADETVHHINGIRDDNADENLQLRTGNHGKGAAFVCRNCGSHDIVSTKIRDA